MIYTIFVRVASKQSVAKRASEYLQELSICMSTVQAFFCTGKFYPSYSMLRVSFVFSALTDVAESAKVLKECTSLSVNGSAGRHTWPILLLVGKKPISVETSV
mmetsp:Transcript_69070/g.109565  ORF Transcript_69070/g.109565 Transcript_69070/m.109565 type:complete len:103 (-) Transcript_69070:255-563(-)